MADVQIQEITTPQPDAPAQDSTVDTQPTGELAETLKALDDPQTPDSAKIQGLAGNTSNEKPPTPTTEPESVQKDEPKPATQTKESTKESQQSATDIAEAIVSNQKSTDSTSDSPKKESDSAPQPTSEPEITEVEDEDKISTTQSEKPQNEAKNEDSKASDKTDEEVDPSKPHEVEEPNKDSTTNSEDRSKPVAPPKNTTQDSDSNVIEFKPKESSASSKNDENLEANRPNQSDTESPNNAEEINYLEAKLDSNEATIDEMKELRDLERAHVEEKRNSIKGRIKDGIATDAEITELFGINQSLKEAA